MSNDNQNPEIPLQALFAAVSRQRDRLSHELALAEATNMVLQERNRELQKAVDAFLATAKPVENPSQVATAAARAQVVERRRAKIVGGDAPQEQLDEVDESKPIEDVAFITG